MTYHAGIGEGMRALGFTPDEPHITCDGCGFRRSVITKYGLPCQWLLNHKAPPGWKRTPVDEYRAQHFCGVCRK